MRVSTDRFNQSMIIQNTIKTRNRKLVNLKLEIGIAQIRAFFKAFF